MRKLLHFLMALMLLIPPTHALGASAFTPGLALENPTPGDPAVTNAWGTIENTGRTLVDNAVAGVLSLSVAGSSNVVLTSVSGGADQSRYGHIKFTGALTGNIIVFWPLGLTRIFSVDNQTSGAFTVTLAVNNGAGMAAGTTQAITQGKSNEFVSDGTNVSVRNNVVTTPVPVTSGGTGLASGTSGGILGFTAATTIASSVALTASAIVLGGGAGATPTPMASLGTTTTVLHGNAAGAPTFGAIALTTDVTGTLPVANGGTGLTAGTSGGILGYTAAGTLASSGALTASALLLGGGAGAVPTAMASLGTTTTLLHGNAAGAPTFAAVALASDVSGQLPMANGGTAANLTASNGGIFYSTAGAGAILAGTATAGQVLRSGATAAPTWSTATYPATAGTAGKVMISDGTNFISSTPTYPNASATAGKVLVSDGTNFVASTPTYPNASATAGKVLVSDGTNFVASTPTYPNASATSLKYIRSDGTNFIASTSTLPDSYSQGDLLYGSAANVISALAKDANATRYLSNTGATNNPAWAQVNMANGVTGTLATGNGGTGSTSGNVNIADIAFVIDGAGAVITTGVKGDLEIPFGCTINSATLLADQSGSIVVNVWADSYANFPPTVADKITAAAPPTITTATKSQDTTLTGWTTGITAGQTLRFNVDSATTITRATLSLKCTKT